MKHIMKFNHLIYLSIDEKASKVCRATMLFTSSEVHFFSNCCQLISSNLQMQSIITVLLLTSTKFFYFDWDLPWTKENVHKIILHTSELPPLSSALDPVLDDLVIGLILDFLLITSSTRLLCSTTLSRNFIILPRME